MSAKLTNEIVDQRLIGRNIKRKSDCLGAMIKIPFQCLIEGCDYEWETTPNNILNDHNGCPKCSGKAKLTNEIVDQRLIGRNIKRLADCENNKTKIPFLCLIETCNYIWDTTPSSILNNHRGCPKCSNRLPLNNKMIDERLVNRNIKRLGDCINNRTKIPFLCLIESCNCKWETTPDTILNKHRGCPKCGGNLPINNEIIDQKLKEGNRNIKRLGNCINNKTQIPFQCLIENCNYIWETAPGSILNNHNGCPKCSGKAKLTNKIIDDKLEESNRNIKRIGDCENNKTKIPFRCLIEECNHIWLACPSNILNIETGCPICSLKKNEKLVYKILIDNNIIIDPQKDIRKIIKNENRHIKVDFYIFSSNTIIEYNGAQHYSPRCFGGISQERAKENFIKQQERDLYLDRFCAKNNIKLIWIDGRRYTNSKLKKYIIDTILPILKDNKY
jgi:hypothetical protein